MTKHSLLHLLFLLSGVILNRQGLGELLHQEASLAHTEDVQPAQLKPAGHPGNQVPWVVMAIFLEKPTPFMEEFWKKVAALEYKKSNIDLFIYNGVKHHEAGVEAFTRAHEDQYRSIEVIGQKVPHNYISLEQVDWAVRDYALHICARVTCDYLFMLDSQVQLDNAFTLDLLMKEHLPIVAPLLQHPQSGWTNFWSSLSPHGYYSRSLVHLQLFQRARKGAWRVSLVSKCFLVEGRLIHSPQTRPSHRHQLLDPDSALMANIRARGGAIYVTQRGDLGHLVDAEGFSTGHLHNELWEQGRNRFDWQQRYIHQLYSSKASASSWSICGDLPVYRLPVFTHTFCQQLVAEAEQQGDWGRLNKHDGVPLKDIGMSQIGFHEEFWAILEAYVRPMQEALLPGLKGLFGKHYMVRYRAEEQASVSPHIDNSTYTVNVALNRPGQDFEGGGVQFEEWRIPLRHPARHGKCPKLYPSRIVCFQILPKSEQITSILKS